MDYFRLCWPCHQPPLWISTDCSFIGEWLGAMEGEYLCPAKDTPAGKDIPAVILSNNGRGCRLILPTGERVTNAPLEELYDWYRGILKIDGDYFPIHGGAVGTPGGAVVFSGASGRGKTTLTAYLSQRGYSYLTDDCVLIRKADLMVLPFHRPIHLRPGGFEVLSRLGMPPSGWRLADTADPRRCWMPPVVQREPLPLKSILFTGYSVQEENACRPLRGAEGLELLMKSPILPPDIDGAYLQFLIALLRRTDCRAVSYRDLDYVAELLESPAPLPKEGLSHGK